MENIFSFWLVDIPVVVGDGEEVRSRHKIWNFRINFYIIFHSWVRDSVQSWLGRNIKYLNCLPSLSCSQSAKSPPTTLLRWHYLTRRMIRALINYPATHENCAKMSVWDNFFVVVVFNLLIDDFKKLLSLVSRWCLMSFEFFFFVNFLALEELHENINHQVKGTCLR